MAAAYLYHLVKNHPFVDGNKRAGALSLLFFLKRNAPEKVPGPEELERVTLSVASGAMTKEELVTWVKSI
jgi:death-on-curing protein